MPSWQLTATGEHSGTASVKTYRANQALPERGCTCECCIHEAYDGREWTNHGSWRPTSIEDPEVLGMTP